MRIVSVPARLVRDPVTQRVVTDDPITVEPTDLYWARLLADGDVAEAPPETDPPVDIAAVAEVVTPIVDEDCQPLNPPAGDIAADIKAPAKIASSKEPKA